MSDKHGVLITDDNPALWELKKSWRTAEFEAVDGIGPLSSLHEAGDAIVAVAKFEDDAATILGSGVMIGPGLLLTATHVLDEFPRTGSGPVFLTFLPASARAWLPHDVRSVVRTSEFDERTLDSDLSLASCSLNSDSRPQHALGLAPMQIALPLIGSRLWAVGFRHQAIEDGAACITPMVSSGLVTAAFPHGRGSRMPSPCFEVGMDTVGGMSGGPVYNEEGFLVGIVSSSFAGGPSYVTLIWDAARLMIGGPVAQKASQKHISIMRAAALGLAKLDGNVDRDPWGDVSIKLRDAETELLLASIPQSGAAEKPAFNRDELEDFLETYQSDIEWRVADAAVDELSRFSLPRVRRFLEASNVPAACLAPIEGFSVEEFDGVEDFHLKGTSLADDGGLRISYYFDLRVLAWTVEVPTQTFQAQEELFRQHFYNCETEGDTTKMEIYQHCYFRGSLVFHSDEEHFSEISITSAAIKLPRKANRREQN